MAVIASIPKEQPDDEIPADRLEELRTKHRELHQLSHAGVTVVVCAPNRHLWNRFRTQMLDERKQATAMEALVRDCVLWPERKDFEAILERRPGLVEVFGKELRELAGAGGDAEKKAL